MSSVEENLEKNNDELFNGIKSIIDSGKASSEVKSEILRVCMISELEAVGMYEKLASICDDDLIKKVLLDISNEEKEHFSEQLTLLTEVDVALEDELIEGEKEVLEMHGIVMKESTEPVDTQENLASNVELEQVKDTMIKEKETLLTELGKVKQECSELSLKLEEQTTQLNNVNTQLVTTQEELKGVNEACSKLQSNAKTFDVQMKEVAVTTSKQLIQEAKKIIDSVIPIDDYGTAGIGAYRSLINEISKASDKIEKLCDGKEK
jgi:rubrerythrin